MSKNLSKLPRHVGIILDGNRRWAKQHGKTVIEGHMAGTDNLHKISNEIFDRGIKELSVYVFSTENWRRPSTEIADLMQLITRFIKREVKEFMERNVQVRISGLRDRVQKRVLAELDKAIEMTRGNTDGTLNFCFNYGGRADILQAVRRLVIQGTDPAEINEERFSGELSTAGMHDVDLVIRTSEQRLSNFLPWEAVYAEVYFLPDRFWPDFGVIDLDNALAFYAAKQRSFGA